MYLAAVNNRKEIEKLDTLTKTAKSLSTYWLKVLEIFKKYISDKNLKPDRLQPNTAMKNYVLIIDEINRSNLPAVLGELIYALEYRGESVETMYEFEGDKKLTLPRNLFIIGTMNTADRSVGHIDYAIRRRFAFVNIQPSSSILDEVLSEPLRTTSKKLFEKVKVLFSTDNIATDFKADDVQLGHSYFLAESEEELNLKFEYEIKPLLIEYIRDGIIRPEISVEGKLQDAENYIENELTL
jgi:5-methylcytosine-specific restriction endonuclease McrBC GTP-binding regulatory subunit McrB